MLVLGRKPGEYVMIGDDIKITVIRTQDKELRLAIEAPKSISIIRGELDDPMADKKNPKNILKKAKVL